jgi:hypothetical protein
MRTFVWIRLGLVLTVLGLGTGQVWAGGRAGPTERALMVKIARNGALLDGGDAILIEARTRCASDYVVVMNNLYVDQDEIDNEQGSLNVICDGRWHRSTVRVESFEGTFEAGEVRVVADITVDSLTGEAPDTDSPLQIVTVLE